VETLNIEIYYIRKKIMYLKPGDAMNEINTTSASGFASNQQV
jgi:hypothetical protein